MFGKTKILIDDFDRRCILALLIEVVNNDHLPMYIKSIAFDILPKFEVGYGRDKSKYSFKLKYHEGWALWQICDHVIRTLDVGTPEHQACISIEEQLVVYR